MAEVKATQMPNTTRIRQEACDKDGNDDPDDYQGLEVVVGVIQYPCCPTEKVIVYEGAHGKVSNKCPRCGRFAEFDYDRMDARKTRARRGAVKVSQPSSVI